MNGQGERERELTLGLLQAIDSHSDITQRRLADRLGVALGLANAYLKRCMRKGWVKVSQAPANRYLYYLTPTGFSEKSRLTALYLRDSFDFYRRASHSISAALEKCEASGCRRVVFAGASELAEIALIRAREHDIRVVAVFDPNAGKDSFLGLPVWRALEAPQPGDVCIVTSIQGPEHLYRQVCERWGAGRVLVPDLLGVRPVAQGEAP